MNKETIFTDRKEAKYCGKTIRKIQEYISNTTEFKPELFKFLNELLNENK